LKPGELPAAWRYATDKASLVQLVFAVLIRVSERWGKKQLSGFEQHQIRVLRQALNLAHPLVLMEEWTKDRSPPQKHYVHSVILQEIWDLSLTYPSKRPPRWTKPDGA
jgi:hypothetical protein